MSKIDETFGINKNNLNTGIPKLINSEREQALAKKLKMPVEGLRSELNVHMLTNPNEITSLIRTTNIPNRIAISGLMNYSHSDVSLINDFLSKLKVQMGINSTGFITSPKPWGNNIDAIVTGTEGKFNTMPLFITPDEFARYISPEQVPIHIREQYNKAAKYVLPNKTANSEAIANAAKGIVIIGGGGDSLLDAIKQIEQHKKVVFINMESLPQEAWDTAKQRPKNAFKYLKELIENFDLTQPLKHPEYKEAGFTQDYLKMNINRLNKSVLFLDLSTANIQEAVKSTINHIH